MVVADKVYTPQMFIEALTGKNEFFLGKDPLSQIHCILKKEGFEKEGQEMMNYPMDEIEHLICEDHNVVLVDVSGFYLDGGWEQHFRWFDITGYEERFQDENAWNRSKSRAYFSITHKEFDAINRNADEHKGLTLQDEEYIIKPFKDWYDILKEGRVLLHNIVHVAKVKYAKGENYLFALRRAEFPDSPYISIEYDRDGRLIAYGQECCHPVTDPKVRDFAEKFRQEVLLPYVEKMKQKSE